MVPEQLSGTNHFISHLETPDLLYPRERKLCENFSKVMRHKFWEVDLNI